MAVANMISQIKRSFIVGNKNGAYTRWLLIALAAGLVTTGGYTGYRWYVVHREQAAQKIFADCLQEYMEAHGGQQQWVNVEQLCKLGYEQNSGSHIAPYFLALQAESLIQQDKKQEAVNLLDTMLGGLSRTTTVYNLYATKRALVNLDIQDNAVQQAGLEQLQALAHDTHNLNRDMALYYLGLYHWSHDSFGDAKDAWQELVGMQKEAQGAPSPWASLVETKLMLIS